MRLKFNGEGMIATALYLLVFYLCLPFSMAILNSPTILAIVIASTILFVMGMILLNKWNYLIVFVALFVFTVIYWWKTWSVQLDTLVYVYYCFVSLMFVFGGMVLYRSDDEVLLRHLFLYITIIFFVTSVTSILGLRIYPLAARELARGSTYDTSLDFSVYKQLYRKMNIVSWSQAYGMLFALPAVQLIWYKRKKLFYLVMFIAIAIMLVESQITFAILLAIVMAAAVFLCQKSSKKILTSLLVIFFVVFFALVFMDNILSLAVDLADRAGFVFLTTKLNDLKTLLLYHSAVGDASARGMLYQKSINTFLSSPLTGLAINEKATLEKIGFHSEFFDLLGTFGIIGLLVIITSFTAYYEFLKKEDKESRRELIIIYLGFMALFIFNPVFNSPQIFVGAFLYPLLAKRYCGMEDIKRSNNRLRFSFH